MYETMIKCGGVAASRANVFAHLPHATVSANLSIGALPHISSGILLIFLLEGMIVNAC